MSTVSMNLSVSEGNETRAGFDKTLRDHIVSHMRSQSVPIQPDKASELEEDIEAITEHVGKRTFSNWTQGTPVPVVKSKGNDFEPDQHDGGDQNVFDVRAEEGLLPGVLGHLPLGLDLLAASSSGRAARWRRGARHEEIDHSGGPSWS
jgi:hypothetical protein